MKDKKKYKYELKLPWWVGASLVTVKGGVMAWLILKGIFCPVPVNLLTP